MKKKLSIYILLLTASAGFFSCKKFLDLKPIDSPTETTFFVDEKGFQAALIAAYDAFQSGDVYGGNFLTLAETRGEILFNNDPGGGAGVNYEIETFAETPTNSTVNNGYLGHFRVINRCNNLLGQIDGIAFDATRKSYIKGQAFFLRSLAYFNAVRLWGKVPLITKTQTTEESRKNKRAETKDIYAQIIADLKVAAATLPTSWSAQTDKGRVTSYAANALLGKVYLYQKDYTQAAAILKPIAEAITAGTTISLVPQTTTFPAALKTSKDILFAVQYLNGGIGEGVDDFNRYRNVNNNNTITLAPSEFETGDNRKELVAPTANGARPGKFNSPLTNTETSGDFPILRCAEVMLMYAEALNEVSFPNVDAFDAINKVRRNAGLTTDKTIVNTLTQADLRLAIYKERKLELVLECDRWFDVVRSGQMASVFPLVQAYRKIYPIPQTEIENVSDKTDWQNVGYY